MPDVTVWLCCQPCQFFIVQMNKFFNINDQFVLQSNVYRLVCPFSE